MLALFIACAGGPDDTSSTDPSITGSVETADGAAEVNIYKAFGRDYDGDGLWFLSSSPEATCESVSDYLRDGADSHDPTGIWAGGDCILTMVVNPQDGTTTYTPGSDFSMTEADEFLIGFWSVRCALGDGAFEWGTRDDGSTDEDYFWTGVEYTAAPNAFESTISGDGEDGGYTIDVSMSAYEGSYPAVIDTIPAEGTISGSIDAEWCGDLLHAGAFPDY